MRVFHLFFIALLAIIQLSCVAAENNGDQKNVYPPKQIIDSLTDRIALASHLMRFSTFLESSPASSINCTCADYHLGNCFSLACGPCDPDAFSWPGGQDLCFHPGPLGTGLLCHVDRSSGKVTENPCCTPSGPTCFLPPGGCDHGGLKSNRRNRKRLSRRFSRADLPAIDLFPWLNTTEVRQSGYRRRRAFVNDTCFFV